MRQVVRDGNYSEAIVHVPPLETIYDATANDSDKSWTVPGNEIWKLNWVHVLLVTTADVGNRQMAISVADASGNVVMDLVAGVVQAASLTRHYGFLQGIFRETAFVGAELQSPIPIDLYLEPGFVLRVYDSAAVAAAADDMTVSFQYQKFVV